MEHGASLTPSPASYNTMLRVLCEAERIDEAMQLLGEAEALGLADERSYTRIISFLHQRGQVAAATKVFARCQDRLLLTQDADAPVARSFLSSAQWRMSDTLGAASPVEPPYMALVRRVASSEKNKELHRLIQAGLWDEAWALFQSWASVGDADTFAFNTIMHGCGSASAALALKADMEAANVPLSLATWNILVQLLAMEGLTVEGCLMLDQMEDRGITPTERTLRPLLKAMFAQGQGSTARSIQQRCKLQRQVKEREAKEIALREADKVVGAQAGAEYMTDTERKDAAAALVAAAIVQQQASTRNTQRNTLGRPRSLSPPPGGWSQFRDRDGTVVGRGGGRRGARRGSNRGKAAARGREALDGSWQGARSIRLQGGEGRGPGEDRQGGGADPPQPPGR
jgi:pentatricopeptide repeat protein